MTIRDIILDFLFQNFSHLTLFAFNNKNNIITTMSMPLTRTSWNGPSSIGSQSNAVWDETVFSAVGGTTTASSDCSAKEPQHHTMTVHAPVDRFKRCNRIRKILGMDHIKRGLTANKKFARRFKKANNTIDNSVTSGTGSCCSNNSSTQLYPKSVSASQSQQNKTASLTSSRQLMDPVTMDKLLSMIRSEEFIGTIDPEYHSCYVTMTTPTVGNSRTCNIGVDIESDCEMTREDMETGTSY
jgi:hypothetical protein